MKKFSLIETMRYEPAGGITLWPYHRQRLERSIQHFSFTQPWNELDAFIESLEYGAPRKIRLLVNANGEYRVEASEIPVQVGPVKLQLASRPVDAENPWLAFKSTRREVYDQFKVETDADDCLLWNERAEITETSIFNIYALRDGVLETPPVAAGLLPGVYRQHLIDHGRAIERIITKNELHASKLFVSNAVRGLLPAVLNDPCD